MQQAHTYTIAPQGYQIWIDGILKAIASSTNEFSDVDGGRPIFTDSDLIVCGRSDKGLNRYFDGKVAHLSIFDYSLDNTTVRTLSAGCRSPCIWCTGEYLYCITFEVCMQDIQAHSHLIHHFS